MIAALSPTQLVVASKHSLGTTTEQAVETVTAQLDNIKLDKNAKEEEQKAKAADASEDKEARAHAEVGREWVARTLKKSGKTTEQLAKRLWDDNMTAILEVSSLVFDDKLTISSATTPLRSTLSPPPTTGRASIFTVSTTTSLTLPPKLPMRLPALRTSLVSS
jgi:tRNA ligase